MSNPINTHAYDGNLDTNMLPDLITIKDLSLDQKLEKGRDIKVIAELTFNPVALHYLDGIIASIGTPDNKDPTNNLVADDLLCLCWNYRDNPDFMVELEAQLIDMKTGFCPQGRTHRLFQTLVAFT